MVFKNIIRYIINRYLKNYIQELDYEKLNFNLMNGHVSLENLRLKPEALNDLNLPVLVAAGFIDKMSITIPWMNLQANTTRFHINGIYLLIVPKNELGVDLSEQHANKMKKVQRKVDELRKAVLENKKLDEEETSFFERKRLQMMQNIEMIIENLHISYETQSTAKLGHPFSFGLTFHYLRWIGTRGVKISKRKKRKTPIIYSLEKSTFVSMYWNTKCKSRLTMSFQEIINDLKSKIATPTHQPKGDDINYILYPNNFDIQMVLSFTRGENKFDRSAIDLDIQVKQMDLSIDSKQFSDLLDFGKFQNYSVLYERCRQYRELYVQACTDDDPLTAEQRDQLKVLERKLDVFNLAYIRFSVENESKESEMETPASNRTESSKSFSKWQWWKKKKSKTAEGHHEPVAPIADIIPEDTIRSYFEDLPSLNMVAVVKKLNMYLVALMQTPRTDILSPDRSADYQRIAHVVVDRTCIVMKKKSVSSNTLFKIDLSSVALFGLQNRRSSPPLLITFPGPNVGPIMSLEFELYPIDKKNSDYRFLLIFEPMSIMYDTAMFDRIVECFDPNDNARLPGLYPIRERTLVEKDFDLSRVKDFDMNIHLKEVSFLLPQYGSYQEGCSMLEIHFDNWIIKSCLEEEVQNREKTTDERFYVKYKHRMENFQIKSSRLGKLETYIIERIPLFDIVFNKCIYYDDTQLTNWYMDVTFSMLERIQLSTENLSNLINHLAGVERMYPTMGEIIRRFNLYFEIFAPHTTIRADIQMKNFSALIHTTSPLSVQTKISGCISKARQHLDQSYLMLEDLNILSDRSIPGQRSCFPFYQNKHLKITFIPN